MLKKICFILVVAIAFSLISVSSFASGNDVISDKNTLSTKQFLVTIYRPEGDETKFDKSYVICGSSEKDDIRVELLIYNGGTGKYEAFKDVDGESGWDVSSELFTKEVSLPNEGANKIRFAAFKKDEAGKLKTGTNLQVNNFTLTVLNKSFIQKIKDNLFSLPDIFNGILNR